MFKSDRILSLDIGASGLKLAEFIPLRSGGVELVSYAVGSLGLDPQSESDKSSYITTTIRELMRDGGIRPGKVLLSVSGQSVFSRFVKLPPVDRDKVEQIIQYEAQQNVPFPLNEVVYDYQLIGSTSGEMDVMLAAIKADIIQQITAAVEAAGLEPDLVDVAPMALYNAVRYNYPQLPGCALVIDMGARSTDLIFIEQSRVFSRSIPVAGNAITQQIAQEFQLSFADAEQMKMAHAFVAFGGAYEGPKSEVQDRVSKSVRSVMTRMHAEINRSINFYRGQQAGQQPSLILLTGGTSVIPYTDTFLKEKLKMEVDYLNPFQNVAVSDSIDTEKIGRHAHVMGQAVGLALRRVLSCPIEIDLMPPNVVQAKVFRRKHPVLVLAAACLVLILAAWCAYYYRMGKLAGGRLARVENTVRQLQGVEAGLRDTEQQMDAIATDVSRLAGLVERRSFWLRVLDQVRSCLPDGMWLNSVRPLTSLETGAAAKPVTERAAAAPAAMFAAGSTNPIRAVEIEGLGYLDKIQLRDFSEVDKVIRSFRDSLRAQPLFTTNTDVKSQSVPGPDDYVVRFKIVAVLNTPFEP